MPAWAPGFWLERRTELISKSVADGWLIDDGHGGELPVEQAL